MEAVSTKKDKIILLIIGLAFFLIGFVVVTSLGSSYTLEVDIGRNPGNIGQYRVSVEQKVDYDIVGIREKHIEGEKLFLELFSVSPGKCYVVVGGPDDFGYMDSIYVHSTGLITRDSFFGHSTGGFVVPLLIELYLLLLLLFLTAEFFRSLKRSLYQYRNIRYLAWMILLIFSIVGQARFLTSEDNLSYAVSNTLSSFTSISTFVFPVAFVLSIFVAVSSIILMKKEGRSIRNMLALLLGIVILAATIIPSLISQLLYDSTFVDLHNENGVALYVEMAANSISYVIIAYLECVLIATIILSIAAAKKTPQFNKDYILILGCHIKKDGSLTPLLKGRADRAIEFSKRQKEATGRDIVFVPSGGKGSDEIMSEAEAVKNYLLSKGIADERIMAEDRSTNTEENFKNSIELIKDNSAGKAPNIAFSTTNYHVFRSGVLARQQGADAEGTGSKTKAYFWINAFVREFVATVFSEWKKHLRMVVILALVTVGMVIFLMLSNFL